MISKNVTPLVFKRAQRAVIRPVKVHKDAIDHQAGQFWPVARASARLNLPQKLAPSQWLCRNDKSKVRISQFLNHQGLKPIFEAFFYKSKRQGVWNWLQYQHSTDFRFLQDGMEVCDFDFVKYIFRKKLTCTRHFRNTTKLLNKNITKMNTIFLHILIEIGQLSSIS